MATIGSWVVLVVLILIFVVAQQRFYSTYRRQHGGLRPLRSRWMGPNAQERGEMRGATLRRDDDPAVERARRVYLVAFAFAAVVGSALVLSGSLFPR